jgi:aminomethyltransferase
MTPLKHTPLYDAHRRLGGRMVEFGGYELPVQYTSIREEHTAVRETAGLFDVSHMGQIHLRGSGAIEAADRVFSRSVRTLAVGRVRYGLLCNEHGGVVDDVTGYRLSDDEIFFCVNASNVDKDHAWFAKWCPPEAGLSNQSEGTGMLALQGPASTEILKRVSNETIETMKRFRCERLTVARCETRVSRTGYTGSAGYELYLAAGDLQTVFDALLGEGETFGLRPAGLGARDTLRLEAALPLYGHELDDDTTPYEAGLDRFVSFDDASGPRDFVGASALRALPPATRQLVGFEVEGRGVARAGYPVWVAGETVGTVTSGSPSPTLGKSIGLAYVPPTLGEPGTRFDIAVRDRPVPARVVTTPFVTSG